LVRNTTTTEVTMSSAVVLLLVLALLIGGVGLFVEGLKWLLIIAIALFVASFLTGSRGRSAV
jgi:hypothetical membrane protein